MTDAGEGLFQECLEMLAKLDGYVTVRRNIETGPFGTLRVIHGATEHLHAAADSQHLACVPEMPVDRVIPAVFAQPRQIALYAF